MDFMPSGIPDGRYAVPFGGLDTVRHFWVRTMGNHRVIYYKTSKDADHYKWESFAFLLDDQGLIQVHKKHESSWTPQQVASAREAVGVIARDPAAASKLYKQTKKKGER
jgi:hypothetical protein